MRFQSHKTYTHATGLSCAFRQWRADSHCSFLHGYAVQIEMTFEATELDNRNWVVDFGGLKPVKEALVGLFDHKTLVAKDDPHLDWFNEAHRKGILDLVIVPSVGCERFAEYASGVVQGYLREQGVEHARLLSLTVREHDGNAATYFPE